MGQNKTNCADTGDELDLRIAHALISGPRKTDQELAMTLGVSRRTISRRRNSSSVQEIFKKTLNLPTDEIRRLFVKGLKKIEEHMDDSDPKVSLSAAIHLTKLATQSVDTLTREEEKEQVEYVYRTEWGNRTEPSDL